jgi:MFS family permease
MTRERVYACLLRRYPRAFRRQYGDEMLQTFRALSQDDNRSPFRFASFMLYDVCRSLVREHLDAWASGMRDLAFHWILACSLGALASGAAVWSFLLAVNALLPPHYFVARDLPTGVYGTLIGLVIGSGQAFVLRRYVHRTLLWIVGTACAGAVGFPLGFIVARLFSPLSNWIGVRLFGYIAGVILLGALVGLTQVRLLKNSNRSSARWVFWNALAVPVGILAGAACQSILHANPTTWHGLVLGWLLYPSFIGIVIGILTVRPLTTLLSRRVVT